MLGVIRPTVEAVPSITKTGHVGILATPATVSSESYVLELEKVEKVESKESRVESLVVTQQACPMWVPLIESGEHLHEGADYFVDKYLREILNKDPQIDTLVLGCTHYPLLAEKIEDSLKSKGAYEHSDKCREIRIIAQGELVAKSLKDYLERHPEYREQLSEGGTCHYLTTENAERFSQSASLFLNSPIQAKSVSLED